MKRPVIIAITVILIIILLFVSLQLIKKNRAKIDTNLLADIERMSEDRDEIYRTHKNYLKSLDELKSKVKMIGDRIERKIKLVRNADKAGDLFRENSLWDLALKNYEIGLEVLPDDGILNYHMGLTYANMGAINYEKTEEYWKKAEGYYFKAIKNSPDYSESYYALSALYTNYYEKKLNLNILPKALNYCSLYLAKNPQSPSGFFLRGRILFNMGNLAQAKESYKIILGLVHSKSAEFQAAARNIKMIEQEELSK